MWAAARRWQNVSMPGWIKAKHKSIFPAYDDAKRKEAARMKIYFMKLPVVLRRLLPGAGKKNS